MLCCVVQWCVVLCNGVMWCCVVLHCIVHYTVYTMTDLVRRAMLALTASMRYFFLYSVELRCVMVFV